MLALIGLILVIAAVVFGAAAVSANLDAAHTLNPEVTVFGQHFAGSQGGFCLIGIAIGAAGMLGLVIVGAGFLSRSRRHAQTRRELRIARRERATAETPRTATENPTRRRWPVFGHRSTGPRPRRAAPQA